MNKPAVRFCPVAPLNRKNMKKFKISQIQFQAKDTPQENAYLLEKLFFK